MRIRTRIIGSALTVMAIICGIFLGYILHKERTDAERRMESRIDRTHARLQETLPGPLYDGNTEQLGAYLDSVFLSPHLVKLSLVEYQGDIRMERSRDMPEPGGRELAGKVVITRGIDELGEVRTVYTTAVIDQRLADSRNEILALTLVLMAMVGLVIFLVARTFTRPIDRLTAAAQAMADGQLDQEIDAHGVRELQILSDSFLRMRNAIREKIDDLADNNRRLNAEIAQRQEAEKERDRLVSVTEATTDLVSMADPQGNILYLNRAGRAMSGVGDMPVEQMRIADFHPQWASELILNEGMPEAIRKGAWSGETALLGPHGGEIPVSQVILSHRDAEGELLYLSTIMRDISERKLTQERLESRDRLLRLLSERVPGVLYQFCMQPDGRISFPYASEGLREIYEVAPEAVRDDATPVVERLHPDDLDAVMQSIQRSFDELTPWHLEYRVVLPLRGERWLRGESMPERLPDGSTVWYGYIADVTESKQSELALRIKDSAIAASINGIAFADLDGRLTYVNRAFLDLWGYAREEDVLGRPAIDFWVDPDEASLVLALMKTEDSWSGELAARRADGSTFEVLLMATAIRDSSGRPLQLMGSFMDVTERKNAEAALKRLNEELEGRVEARTVELVEARDEAERASLAKSEFLSRMSHELRTPLNAILGFSQLLESDPEQPLSAIQHDNVQEILRAGEHLLELINEVLDLARIEAGKLSVSTEAVPLMPLIEESLTLIQPLAEQRGIRVVEGGRDCGEHVHADRVRLKQVLVNLLSNAVKYNREQGTLGIVCVSEGDSIQVRISDTGMGLSTEQQARLFAPFERLDADKSAVEGTGIGLALSKRLVEVMHGEIGVESRPGVGSTFWVRLPLVDGHAELAAPAARTDQAETAGIAGGQRHDVLCIEDNPANLRLIERILARREDVRLLTAGTPTLGLELAVAHRPALILLDINLPEMDGYEVMQCLRESAATRDIPVVAISANAMPKDLARGRAAGFKEYLTKPLQVERLLQVLDAVLRLPVS